MAFCSQAGVCWQLLCMLGAHAGTCISGQSWEPPVGAVTCDVLHAHLLAVQTKAFA